MKKLIFCLCAILFMSCETTHHSQYASCANRSASKCGKCHRYSCSCHEKVNISSILASNNCDNTPESSGDVAGKLIVGTITLILCIALGIPVE